MMPLRIAIPKGVRVYPPEEAERRRAVEERILTVFKRWGFREVITPTFEYLEVFTKNGEEEGDRVFKFIDRQTGRLLALRYDLTPQVARMVATTMRHRPLPLRLAYAGSVFRYEEPHAGRQREFVQLGVELIGLDRPEADAEMIAMAVEGCQAVGLGHFQIDVGQVEFLRGLLDELPDRDGKRQVISALRRKDALELELCLQKLRVPETTQEVLLQLPSLYGGKEVLERAAKLTGNHRSQEALENLRQVLEVLETYGLLERIIVDLGEVHALDYYTGVVFGVFSKGLGYQLAGGGRYDQLIGTFGYPCPATGFAFELEKLLLAMEAEGIVPELKGPSFLIIDFNPDKRRALRIARLLREQGYSVARDIIRRDLDGSLRYAEAERIRWAIILGGDGVGPEELIVREVASGKEEVYPVEGFCHGIESERLRWPM